jgi:hypothetical protein
LLGCPRTRRPETPLGGLFCSDIAWRLVGPSMEPTTKVGGIAESQRQGNVVVRKPGRAQILHRNLGAELVQQAAIGEALLPKLAAQGAVVHPEKPGRRRGGWWVGKNRQEKVANLSGDADSQRHRRADRRKARRSMDRWSCCRDLPPAPDRKTILFAGPAELMRQPNSSFGTAQLCEFGTVTSPRDFIGLDQTTNLRVGRSNRSGRAILLGISNAVLHRYLSDTVIVTIRLHGQDFRTLEERCYESSSACCRNSCRFACERSDATLPFRL